MGPESSLSPAGERWFFTLLGALAVTPLWLWGSSVQLTHTFENGAVADAAAVNQNFVDVRSAVDENSSRLDNLLTGVSVSGGNLEASGFTALGSAAPKVKMKLFTGTSPASATMLINHGLDPDKILDVAAAFEQSGTGTWFRDYGAARGHAEYFETSHTNTQLRFTTIGTSLQGRPYRILVTYEE